MKCDNPDCQNLHGPYFYAYWKQDKKLNKRYVGKNLEDFQLRKIAKEIKIKPSQLIKLKFIEQEASFTGFFNTIGEGVNSHDHPDDHRVKYDI